MQNRTNINFFESIKDKVVVLKTTLLKIKGLLSQEPVNKKEINKEIKSLEQNINELNQLL